MLRIVLGSLGLVALVAAGSAFAADAGSSSNKSNQQAQQKNNRFEATLSKIDSQNHKITVGSRGGTVSNPKKRLILIKTPPCATSTARWRRLAT